MVIIGCLFWLFLWVVLMWIIGNVTSWWMVLAINIGALLYIYLDDRKNSYYDEYRDYKKKRKDEETDDKAQANSMIVGGGGGYYENDDIDYDSYRAAREERDAYDDYWASIDMDNDR